MLYLVCPELLVQFADAKQKQQKQLQLQQQEPWEFSASMLRSAYKLSADPGNKSLVRTIHLVADGDSLCLKYTSFHLQLLCFCLLFSFLLPPILQCLGRLVRYPVCVYLQTLVLVFFLFSSRCCPA